MNCRPLVVRNKNKGFNKEKMKKKIYKIKRSILEQLDYSKFIQALMIIYACQPEYISENDYDDLEKETKELFQAEEVEDSIAMTT